MARDVAYGIWVNARTSATSGTATVVTVYTIGTPAAPLSLFDELTVYLDVTTALAGTTPTMNLYLQRAIRPNADPATDADWEDFYASLQVTTGIVQHVVTLPSYLASAPAVAPNAVTHTRSLDTMTADSLRQGHQGHGLRIREKIGGTVTQAAVYSIYARGVRYY